MTTETTIQTILDTPHPWIADGGLETALIFHEGIELPLFASLAALETEEGRAAMTRYFEDFIDIAAEARTGFVIDTATWRSGAYWAPHLMRSEAQLLASNRAAVAFAKELRARHADRGIPMLVNGAVGPAGDGYQLEDAWTPETAEAIHWPQVSTLAKAGVDLVSAVTMTHPGEAIGIARAARRAGVPVTISFTVETDGRLPNGQTIGEAIAEVDAATAGEVLWYMINCAHPDHFHDALAAGEGWPARIGGVRANASRMSHAELDEAEELDDGDPQEFGQLNAGLGAILPNLRLVGGCCGTDARHIGCTAHHLHSHAA